MSPGSGVTLSHRAGTARGELPAQHQSLGCAITAGTSARPARSPLSAPDTNWLLSLTGYNWIFKSSLKLKIVDILEVTAR